MKGNIKGITLIELIISSTLIIILSIIGGTSYFGYLGSLRDSARVIELHNLDTVFRGYNLKSGRYPIPTDYKNILFSGSLVWKQGVYGDSVSNMIGYSRNVSDPLTNSKYAYSITNYGNQFSLAGVFESSTDIVYKNLFFKDVFAEGMGKKEGLAFVVGDFNGEVVHIKLNSLDYILAIPSIISTDLSSTNLDDIINNNRLVYTDFNNLPASYIGSEFNLDSNIDFSTNDLIIFSGSIIDLNKKNNQVNLIQNLYNSYSGSLLGNKISINTMNKVDLFADKPSNIIERIACDFINFRLKYTVECG